MYSHDVDVVLISILNYDDATLTWHPSERFYSHMFRRAMDYEKSK